MKKNYRALVLELLSRNTGKPLSERELASKIGVKKKDYPVYLTILANLVASGEITVKKHRFAVPAKNRLKSYRAQIVKVNETFGFARIEGEDTDVFIPGRYLMGSMPGDQVMITAKKGLPGQLPDGQVVEVLSTADQAFSGVVLQRQGRYYIAPDNLVRFPMEVLPSKLGSAKPGDKVLARISRRGRSHTEHRIQVLEVFGDAQSAEVCARAILAANGIRTQFPEEVLEQAASIAKTGLSEKELKNRLDLRDKAIFTIDGADSKDLDDAVSIEKGRSGWKLGVHIADVSHYVTRKSPLDIEAFERGTSVYYANAVVPMLPPELSNGICSLNPGEDRLAFSALMELDDQGGLKSYRFCKSVIRSRVKGVYGEINQIFDRSAPPELLEKYAELLPSLKKMRELAGILAQNRTERGAVNLESTESKILMDEEGRAREILPRQSGEAEGMIEEFMLMANQAAASLAMEKGIPFIYRVHESPSPEKLENLSSLLKLLGLDATGLTGKVSSARLAEILKGVEGTHLAPLINSQILRSMAKARYSETNIGHFGLVLDNYAHFTSPIRRYPDLVIHRILSALLDGLSKEQLEKRYLKFVPEAAVQSSNTEQKAMTVERQCEDCYKAEYMLSHIGETFDGMISGVMSYGIYVELPNTVEGLVRVDHMPQGDYICNDKVTLTERISGARYRIGDLVRIKVTGADVSAGDVDFALVCGEN